MRRRLTWYMLFSLGVVALMLSLQLPREAVAAYALIALLGFAIALRDHRSQVRTGLERELLLFADREAARITANQALARQEPWYEELEAAQQRAWEAAFARNASGRLFTSYNPYWSLDFESLVAHGLTTHQELNVVRRLARSEPPPRWRNPFILRELTAAGNSYEDALVRIGLYMLHQPAGMAARPTCPDCPQSRGRRGH